MQAAAPSAWEKYFLAAEYTPTDRRNVLIQDLVRFFSSAGSIFLVSLCSTSEGSYSLEVDYASLEAACGSADLVAAMDLQPADGLACVAIAAYEVCRSVELRLALSFFLCPTTLKHPQWVACMAY
jgi:hypothetical protein